jgi:hypothetical protein
MALQSSLSPISSKGRTARGTAHSERPLGKVELLADAEGMRRGSLVGLVVVAGGLLAGHDALAYPSAVVFAPSGEVRPFGEVGLYGYTALQLTSPVQASSTWFGFEVGIIPRLPYGKSGFEFGGLEVGVDLFVSDLSGTAEAYPKPVLNFKLQLLVEHGWLPSLSVGVMDVSPYRASRSMNFIYGSLTKTLRWRGHDLGRATVGLGGVANDFTGDPFRVSAPAFQGSWPFDVRSRLSLLLGYESPSWGPVSLALDYVGGASEIGSTNLALVIAVAKIASWSLGGWFGNDPAQFTAGGFTSLYVSWDLKPKRSR